MVVEGVAAWLEPRDRAVDHGGGSSPSSMYGAIEIVVGVAPVVPRLARTWWRALAVSEPGSRRWRRRRGSRAARWSGHGRTHGRSGPATARSARGSGTWRAGAPRDAGGALWRRGAHRRGTPRTEQTASWIAATLGPSASGERRARRAGDSQRPADERRVIGSASIEARATTRVIAPSSRRTFAGRRPAISWSTTGSGSSGEPIGAIRQSRVMRVRRSGGSSSTLQTPLEAVAQALGEPGERLGRPVAGEHDLLAGAVERVEGVDELLLGALLALEHLDVVDQQRVELAVALLEALGPLAAQRGHELGREPLGGGVGGRCSSG